MVSQTIVDYLRENDAEVEWHEHERAVTAERLAESLHVPARQVAKPVLVKADGRFCIALVPGNRNLDLALLADALAAIDVRLAWESEFARLFPDCETGSQPPFGNLYFLPVVMDETLAEQDTILFRAGSHVDAIEMLVDDFIELEKPQLEPLYQQSRPANPPPRWPITEAQLRL